MRDTIDMAREAGFVFDMTEPRIFVRYFPQDGFDRLVALVRADEREQIEDEWSMCVQSDLEHGAKSLNERAAKDWFKNYPEIAKFGAWLAERGNT